VLKTGLAQYRLIVANAKLLGKTLNGSIKMLTDIPPSSIPSRSASGKKCVNTFRLFAESLKLNKTWIWNWRPCSRKLDFSDSAKSRMYSRIFCPTPNDWGSRMERMSVNILMLPLRVLPSKLAFGHDEAVLGEASFEHGR